MSNTYMLLKIENCNISKLSDIDFINQTLIKAASMAKMFMIGIQPSEIQNGLNYILIAENAQISFNSFLDIKAANINLYGENINHYDCTNALVYIAEEFESKHIDIKINDE